MNVPEIFSTDLIAPVNCENEINSNISESELSIQSANPSKNPSEDGVANGGPQRNPRYKTEICRNYKEKAKCIYGDNCQFAHGKKELREVVRNTKYKTKLCQKYWVSGYCVYGPRCNFLHDELQKNVVNRPDM